MIELKKALSAFLVTVSVFALVSVGPLRAEAISAKAAAVINGDTGELLFSKNSDERLPMASTTKIMTALLLCENTKPDKTIVTTKQMVAVEGSSMGLLAGDTVSCRDLLYGMMLASGNDAANTAAFAVSGSVEAFVRLMNKRAAEMGLKNTHFQTPSGLDGDAHYTTAYELALLSRQALLNDDFAAAAASKSATLCYGNPPYKRMLSNHNRLLKTYDDVIGVKTGFTKKSGRCLVSAAKKDGKYVIAVTLNDPDDWSDHRKLLDIGLDSLESVEAAPDEKSVKLNVIGGERETLELNFQKRKICVSGGDSVTAQVNLPEFLYAPVKKGDKIGEILYRSGENVILSQDITAPCDIEKKNRSIFYAAAEILKFMLTTI